MGIITEETSYGKSINVDDDKEVNEMEIIGISREYLNQITGKSIISITIDARMDCPHCNKGIALQIRQEVGDKGELNE